MTIFIGIFSNITSIIALIIFTKKKAVEKSNIFWAFIFSLYGIIINLIIGYVASALKIEITAIFTKSVLTVVEEIIKCFFFILCFNKKRGIYKAALFGLTFAMIENLLLTPFNYARILPANIGFFSHSAYLMIFEYIYTRWDNNNYSFILGITTASFLHVVNNLIVWLGDSTLLYGIYLATLFEIVGYLLKKEKKDII